MYMYIHDCIIHQYHMQTFRHLTHIIDTLLYYITEKAAYVYIRYFSCTQAGPSSDSARSCGHEGEDRPRHTVPGTADVPEVLPRPTPSQLSPVCRESVGRGGEEGEHGSGAGLPHVSQV